MYGLIIGQVKNEYFIRLFLFKAGQFLRGRDFTKTKFQNTFGIITTSLLGILTEGIQRETNMSLAPIFEEGLLFPIK